MKMHQTKGLIRQTEAVEMKSERDCQMFASSFWGLSTTVTGFNRKEVGSEDRRRKHGMLLRCLNMYH